MTYFHYTNIESFFYMVTTKKAWFSSLAFMNDEMEGFDLKQVLEEVLHLKHGEENCRRSLHLIEETINTYLRTQMSFSASTLSDDISQWRAYTQLGLGICIEFEDGFIRQGDARKIECIYDKEEKRQAIVNNRSLKANDMTIESLLDTHDGIREYVESIINSLVSFKNASFKPEKEVRWITINQAITDKPTKFRPHRLGLTTYKEVPIYLEYVKSITIGPQVPDQNLKSIEDFIIKNGCSGSVTKSKVTLR